MNKIQKTYGKTYAKGIAMAVLAISISGCITEPYRENERGRDETRYSPPPARYYPEERGHEGRYDSERPARSNRPNEMERESRPPRFPPPRISPFPEEAPAGGGHRRNQGRDEGER